MDGQSMKPLLMGKTDPTWRTRFASEFAEGGVQTYGPFPIYDNPDNQWRMLRVINTTHNIAYIEFDKEYVFAKIDFFEYYNVAVDPWQQKNLWNTSSPALKAALHAELVNMFTCTGTRTEVSNCHARSSSPLAPPAPTPAPPAPTPPTPKPPHPAPHTCTGEMPDVVLNNTDIGGGDMISPCPQVDFPGTYSGAVQCEASCAANSTCVAWTFHLKGHEGKWRCCIKSKNNGCAPGNGMWSGFKKANVIAL
jgi:hypothetical protein